MSPARRGRFSMKRKYELLLVFGLVAVCSLMLLGNAFAEGGPRAVTVDAGTTIGYIRSLQGGHFDLGPVGQPLSNTYVALGIDMIRTHDAGGFNQNAPTGGEGDIDGVGVARIFPDLNADPEDPASYNFAPTDALIKNITDIGAKVYFRVGRSNLVSFGGGFPFVNSYVPPDLDKYADIVKHVVMHYNKGWANGFHYGIRYFEIWNEPDILPFWSGTPEQYHELYQKVSLAIRAVDKHAKIGGPANTTNNDFTGLEESLMQFIVDNNLPMDFYSFHHYANHAVDPYNNVRLAQKFRNLLDTYGFKHAEVIDSEYGGALDGTPMIGGPVASAIFTGEVQMYMQDAPVRRVTAYMGVSVPPSMENNAFGMVSTLNRTPQRLWTDGGDNTGFAVLAGKAGCDMDKHDKHVKECEQELRVIIANYEISTQNMGEPILDSSGNPLPNNTEVVSIPGLGVLGTWVWLPRRTITYENTNGYNLEIKNIPKEWGDLTVEQYRIDNDNNMALVNSWTIYGKDRFSHAKKNKSSGSVLVSGAWVHSAPNPPLDPVGVAQGMDLIVVTGSGGGHCH